MAKTKPNVKPKKKAVAKAGAPRAKTGVVSRKVVFSPALGAAICDMVAEGQALPAICRRMDMPSRAAVYNWLASGDRNPESDHGKFTTMYARACEMRAELMAEELLDIADDSRNDYMLRLDVDGAPRIALDAENIQRSKLRTDARKWLMAKMVPWKYGEKIEHAHGGTDGAAIKYEHALKPVMTPIEAAQAYGRFIRGQD